MHNEHRAWWMSRWFLPTFSVILGIIAWMAFWIGGDTGEGAFAFGVMALFGAVLLAGGRSETMRAFRGDGRDERWQMIDLRATALSGLVLITAVMIGFFVEVASGKDGSPYGQLAAIAGITYLVGFFLGRWKT